VIDGTSVLGSSVGISSFVTHVLVKDLFPEGVGLADRRVAVEDVDLFERETLGFGNAEVGEEETEDTTSSPDPEYVRLETSRTGYVVDEVRSSVTDREIEEPVRSGRHGHLLSSGGGRVDLGGNDPGERSPGSGEMSDEDADESDEDFLGGLVAFGSGDTDNSDDKL